MAFKFIFICIFRSELAQQAPVENTELMPDGTYRLVAIFLKIFTLYKVNRLNDVYVLLFAFLDYQL